MTYFVSDKEHSFVHVQLHNEFWIIIKATTVNSGSRTPTAGLNFYKFKPTRNVTEKRLFKQHANTSGN
jgi:hypothetical protein